MPELGKENQSESQHARAPSLALKSMQWILREEEAVRCDSPVAQFPFTGWCRERSCYDLEEEGGDSRARWSDNEPYVGWATDGPASCASHLRHVRQARQSSSVLWHSPFCGVHGTASGGRSATPIARSIGMRTW